MSRFRSIQTNVKSDLSATFSSFPRSQLQRYTYMIVYQKKYIRKCRKAASAPTTTSSEVSFFSITRICVASYSRGEAVHFMSVFFFPLSEQYYVPKQS